MEFQITETERATGGELAAVGFEVISRKKVEGLEYAKKTPRTE